MTENMVRNPWIWYVVPFPIAPQYPGAPLGTGRVEDYTATRDFDVKYAQADKETIVGSGQFRLWLQNLGDDGGWGRNGQSAGHHWDDGYRDFSSSWGRHVFIIKHQCQAQIQKTSCVPLACCVFRNISSCSVNFLVKGEGLPYVSWKR